MERLLTSRLTVANLRGGSVLTEWLATGDRPKERVFLYAQTWLKDLAALPAPQSAGTALRPVVSMADGVRALVSGYVAGEPLPALIRPRGQGMCPVFKRLRPPDRAIVEMRTRSTRTFGFLATGRVYVAVAVNEADVLKRSDPGYSGPIARVKKLLECLAPSEVDEVTDVNQLI